MRDPYDCTITTLPSGIRCYVQHDPSSRHCVLDMVVWVGGLEDPDGKEGLAHLYEHVVFGGTERFPSQMALNGPIEEIGGGLNATTNAVRTHFYAVVPAQHATLAADILTEMVFRPRLTSETLAHEKGVIEAEIDRKESSHPSEAIVATSLRSFGPRFARRTWGVGWRETLSTISRDDLLEWRERYFQPRSLSLIATGNLAAFGGDPAHWFHDRLNKLHYADADPAERRLYRADLTHDMEAWSFDVPNPPKRHPILELVGNFHEGGADATDLFVRHEAVAAVIKNILTARGMTSVLKRELRDRRGWIYTAHASTAFLSRNLGGWGITVELKRDGDMDAVLNAVRELLANPETFSDAEVVRAQVAILGEDALRVESPNNTCGWIRDSLTDEERVVARAEWLERIGSVDPVFVRDVIARRFAPERTGIIRQTP